MFFLRSKSQPAMDPQEAVKGAREGRVTVVDVRDLTELKSSGKAKGSLHIPLMRVQHMADPSHPDFVADLRDCGPVVLYCASGARSGMAARALRKLGYTDVHNIGSFANWLNAGGPVERV